MTSWCSLSVSITLPYPQAGVALRLDGACHDHAAPTVDISALSYGTEQALSLQSEAVPVLEDFAPGFSRWLRTCRIEADVTPQVIRGHMATDTAPGQLLLALERACDMIDQRFSLYTESIVS